MANAVDKYRPTAEQKRQILIEQIQEMQRISYRNDLENLTFVAEGNKAKQGEVTINNTTLQDKMDLFYAQLEAVERDLNADLNADRSDPSISRPTL